MQSLDVTNEVTTPIQPIAEEQKQILEKLERILDPEILLCAQEYLNTLPKVIEVVSAQIEDLLKQNQTLDPSLQLINFAKRIIAFIKHDDYSDNSILLLKSFLESKIANKYQIKNKITEELSLFNQEILQEQKFHNYNILLESVLVDVIDLDDTRTNLKRHLQEHVSKSKEPKLIESLILSTATLPNFRNNFSTKNDLEALTRGIFEIGKKQQNLTLSVLYFCAYGQLENCFANDFEIKLSRELIELVTYEKWADFCDLIPLLHLKVKDHKINIDDNTLEDLKEVFSWVEYSRKDIKHFNFKQVFQLATELFSPENTAMILILTNYFKRVFLVDQTFDLRQLSNLVDTLKEFPSESVLFLLKDQRFKHSYLPKMRTWLSDCTSELEKQNFYEMLIQLYQHAYGDKLNLIDFSSLLSTDKIPPSIIENEVRFHKIKNGYINNLNLALSKGIFSNEFIDLLNPESLVSNLRHTVVPSGIKSVNIAKILTDFRDKFALLQNKSEIHDKIILAENLIMLTPEISALGISSKLIYEQVWSEALELISR